MTITKRNRLGIKKAIALFMLFTLINQTLAPSIAYALTAGPTAPEATNFEPIDTTDMVNPLTGSFTYNMPLLEVPGPEGSYPLSLSYHAGVQPNEEASWVGLGWTLNPGAIARNVNGYPDDWSAANGAGGTITSYWSGGQTTTYSIGIGVGIAGSPASVNVGLSFASDTYRGFGVGFDVGVGSSLGGQSPFGIGLTIGVSPYGQGYAGLNLSYSAGISGSNGLSSTTSIGLQTNFNTVSADLSEGISSGKTSLLGASIGTGNMKPSFSLGGGSATSVNNPSAGKISTSTDNEGISIPIGFLSINLGYSYTRYWSATSASYSANGVLNNRSTATGDFATTDDDNYSILDPINYNIIDQADPLKVMGGTFPDFDDYNVTAQGLGGNMRPYIFSSILFNQNRVNNNDHSNDVTNTSFPLNTTPNPIGKKWQFRFLNDQSNAYKQQHPWISDQEYGFDSAPQYGNNDGTYGYDPTSNRLEGSSHIEYFTNAQITSGAAALRGFVDCDDVAGFSRTGSFNLPGQVGGFMITNANGVTYHYALPAYSYGETVFTKKTDNSSWNNLLKATPYAYTWFLTAITGPDYVSRGTAGTISSADWGYWVKFVYGKWTDTYAWANPAQGDNADLDNQFKSHTTGTKQLYYLDAIQTRTHTAIFEKEIRADGHDATGLNGVNYSNAVYYGSNGVTASTLRLNNIYLFQNDQLPVSIDNIRSAGTFYQQTLNVTTPGTDPGQDGTGGTPATTNTVQPANGQNVIDKYDINPSWASNCLRKIALNYDYSLSPGCPNSYDPGGINTYFQNNVTVGAPLPGPLLGKLTLLSLDFQGKGGTPITPPLQFQYDNDPSNPANQGDIAITQAPSNTPGVNQPGTIQVKAVGNFNAGDVLSFQINGITYYCTLLSTPDNGSTFKVLFLNNSPGAASINQIAAAVKTKNPPYNYDAFDNWQSYKSDYIANPGNVNLARFTTPVSSLSADAWSLRRIVSSVGANININYEGNTFKKSVLNKNPSVIVSGGGSSNITISGNNVSSNINSDGTIDLIASNPQNVDLSQIFIIGTPLKGPVIFYREQAGANTTVGYQLVNLDTYPQTKILSITGNDIKISLDPNLIAFVNSAPLRGNNNYNTTPVANASFHISVINFTTGNLTTTGSANINYGGGIRIKNLIVDDLNGNVKQTSYNYGALGVPASQRSTSGVTSYMPTVFDPDNLAGAINTSYLNVNAWPADASLENDYRKILYRDINYLLAISRIVPSPGVLYETVAVNDFSILPNGTAAPIDGTTVYQYEVFKQEMVGLQEYHYDAPYSSGPAPGGGVQAVVTHAARDVSIKDYTSRIGNLKRVVTYDNQGNKLTEKINHYLNDDLDNTSFQSQIANYEPRLASTASLPYNGVAYNNMGVIQERYGTGRGFKFTVGSNFSQQDYFLVLSNKETFPAFQTGTTQIDYKNGTRMDKTNLAYDFYTGAVTKTLTTDSYGNRFISQATPAYTASNGSSLVYPALGLKTHDDDAGAVQHKQMLTQQASNYTFSADINNNPIGVVTASAQTWSNATPVLDQDGNLTTTGQANIWRMEKTLSWLAAGTTANNTTPYASFVDYFKTGGSSNVSWKKTSQITKYNVYSNALEATDINNNYASTRMGYNNSKVLISGSTAMYNEIAYAGAEDALLTNGNFSNNISKGGGTIVTDSTNAHTGVNTLLVPANTNGFTYTVPITNLNPVHQSYSVGVWVKPPAGGNVNLAQLYYQSGAGAIITSTQTYSKSAAGWYLLEMTVPTSAITSGNLIVGCKNASAGNLYFDDFRFQPTAASATSYVYDNKTGELTYSIGNNNLYTRYQYDAIGRLVRVYKEVIGKSNIPIVKGIAYNYGKFPTACPVIPVSTPPSTSSSVSSNSFVTSNPMDNEWQQEAPPGYTIASDDGTSINTGKNAGINAGRFAYFSTAGTVTPPTTIGGTLTFSAKGTGTIEVQLIATNNSSIQARKTFALTSAYQNFSWTITGLLPQLEMAAGVIVNGGNSSSQATVQLQNNFSLNLNQLALGATYTRFRADQTSLIGNSEKDWYGWSDPYKAPRKKYLQHSAYARMRFQTTATQIGIEYVRDFYDKRVVNLFPITQAQSGKVWDSNGNVVAGTGVVNTYTQVTGGQTYTISGLLTTQPTFVWYHNGTPLAAPAALTNVAAVNQPPLYQVTAPATATNLGLLVQNSNDNYLVYSNCMVQQGAIGTVTPLDGTIPSAYTPFSGYTASHISGPAIFINGVLYKYYQVEGNDVAKVIQFVTDVLPAGNKTVEVMMPGQGTYLPADPHVRRAGTYLRAVYFPGSTTTVSPSTTVAPGSIVYIHDSILSGYNISTDAQNNVWMMMTQRNPSYGFTGDIFSEGYAGRILATDIGTPALTAVFAAKLASFGVDKYWFQIGVNDYGFNTSLPVFYRQYKSLIEQLKVLRPNAKIYIQSIGPESYEGPNGETVSDDKLSSTGPSSNDFRDVQRAIATSHSYCEYVNFEGLFPAVIANTADGIHPTDAGNVLYANGVKNKSTLLGTVQPVTPLAFYRSTARDMVQDVASIYTITATGGKAPYTFTNLSGTLPAGLTFNADGTITGTPGAGGSFPISVKVTDANASSVTQSFTLTVDLLPPVVVGPQHIINAQVNMPYTKTFDGFYGFGPYTFSVTSGAVPAGMMLDGKTGILSGTPINTGTSTFTITATDHWGFFGTTDYALITGTTVPVALSDNFTVTASVTANNHLLLTGHLNDMYSQTLFTYIGAYYTPAGGSEIFLSGNLVNVAPGLKNGVPVDMGAMGLLPGTFSVRLVNGGINPSILDNVNISYNATTTQTLTTSNSSPTEQFAVTATINSLGHLIVTASLPNAPSTVIYSAIGAGVTQNGTSTYMPGPSGGVTINAGALTSTGVDFGLVPASTGSVAVQLFIGGVSPNADNGYVITFNPTSNLTLTMPPPH
jgi:hypothetical protein